MPRAVQRVAARLKRIAKDGVIELGGFNSGLRDGRLGRNCAKFDRRAVAKAPPYSAIGVRFAATITTSFI